MKNILILLLIFLIACKNKESKVSTQEIDYQAYADSLKQAYKKHYAPVYTPPNDSIAKIRKPPYEYVSYIGLSEFCYDKTRVNIHRILLPNNAKDLRFEGKNSGFKNNNPISDESLGKMTIKERLVYALLYPEQYSQSCSIYISQEEIEYRKQYIVFHKRRAPEGFHMSERQQQALSQDKDSVAYYLKACYQNKKTIPLGISDLILQLKLYQITPLLLQFTRNEEDYVSLTICMHLMFDDNYQPFIKSQFLKDAILQSNYSGKDLKLWSLKPMIKNDQRISELESLIQSYYEWKMVTHSNTL